MTVYLNRMFFKPALIVLSCLFGLALLVFGILTIALFQVGLLVITLLIAATYGVLVWLAYRVSKSEKYYLQEEYEGIFVRYPTINFDRGVIRIPFKALIGFEFYPLKSKQSWINFFETGTLPNSVFVTYINRHGRAVKELLGYITESDAEALARRYKIKFTLK